MQQTALLLIDFQNDYFSSFEGAKWPLHQAEAAVENAALIVEQCRLRNIPVIHVHHEFESDEAPFFIPGSSGANIHDKVAPRADEITVLKHQVNCFQGTPLRKQLEQQGIKNLIIAGAMSHMCIDAGTRAAKDFGYECTVIADACATRDLDFNGQTVPAAQVHAAYMSALAFAYAQVVDTQTLLKTL